MSQVKTEPLAGGEPDRTGWRALLLLPALLPAVLLPWLALDSWSVGGSGDGIADHLAAPACYVLALAALGWAAFAARNGIFRRTSAWFGALLLAATLAGQTIAGDIRDEGIAQLARSAEPLVRAIAAYEVRHGRPPETLAALVPEFLPALPATGIPAARTWQYEPLAPDPTGGGRWWLAARVGMIGDVEYVPDSKCAPSKCPMGGSWRFWRW
jgi:hypothetical protein